MAPRLLLGPPELYKPDPRSHSEPASGDPFSDQLTANFNNPRSSNQYPRQGQTEKGAATYLSSGNPCLDFFFHVLPRTPPNSLTSRLSASWSQEPHTVLKLAAYWMFANHPRTLACNVEQFAEFGYFKDLPEVLYSLVEGSDARRKQKEEWSRRAKVEIVKKMEWGRAANFQEVFDRILSICVKGKLKPEEMVRTVFVFSDMEFDKALPNPWETDYQMIKRKYEEHGYGACVLLMVFWNLRESNSTPVIGMQKGAALVSWYSKNMLKLFLRGGAGGIWDNPEEVMTYTISGPEYQKLQVMD